jgi:signal transduction histidine kinase
MGDIENTNRQLSAEITRLHGEVSRLKALEAEHRRRAEEFRFLTEASTLLSSSLDYEHTLHNLAQLAVAYISDWCTIYMLDADGNLQRPAVKCASPAKQQFAERLADYPVDPGHPLLHALTSGEPMLSSEVPESMLQDTVQSPEHLEALQGLGLRSWMVVPMLSRGQLIGGIGFAKAESRQRFDQNSLALATELARRAATAIDNARLYTDVKRAETALREVTEWLEARTQQLAVVAELGQRALAGAGTGLDALMDETARLTAETLKVEFCELLELLPDGRELVLRAGVGWNEDYPVGEATVNAELGSQAGYTLLSDEPVIVHDLRTETRFTPPPLLSDHGVVTGMTVIIARRDRPFGILGAHTRQRRTFTYHEVNFLRSVANVVALAIERHAAEETLVALNATLEQRVAERTTQVRQLAFKLIGAERQERQRIARVLHDDLQQQLYAAQFGINALAQDVTSGTAAEQLDNLRAMLNSAVYSARTLSRSLRPPGLEQEDLDETLHWLASYMEDTYGLAVVLQTCGDLRIAHQDIRELLYEVTRELLFNVFKHANVNRAVLRVQAAGGDIVVNVADEGEGFDATQLERSEFQASGLGLFGIRERLKLIDASFEINSAPGQGTQVEVRLPLTIER